MAAKVNTKFVVILSVVLLILAGGVAFLGATVLLKSAEDNIRRGDQLVAQGEFIEATKSYGKAVNKENYNAEYLRKWLSAVERSIPATDVEYTSMYRDQYIGALRQLAVVERTNPQTQDDMLSAYFRQNKLSGTSAEGWGQFAEIVTNALDGLDMSQPEAQRLLRYRGLASVFRFRTLETVSQVERARADDDLAKALEADPDDLEAELGRVELISATAMELFRAGRSREAASRWSDAMDALDRVEERFPNSPVLILRRTLMNTERAVQISTNQTQEQAIGRDLQEGVARTLAAAASAPTEDVSDEQFLGQLSRAVGIAGSPELRQRWLDLLNTLLEERPDYSALVLERGKALAGVGRHEDAIESFERVATMPDIPISLDGLILKQLRTEARRQQIESGLALWNEASGEERDRAMARVLGFREALAARVPSNNAALLRSDAQIAFAERRLDDAVAALTELRNVTGGGDSEVLVMLGRALAAQQKIGAAAEQFRRVYERDPRNLSALLALIDLELNSGNRAVARELLDEAKRLAPDNEVVRRTEQFFNIQREGIASSDDPVINVLNASLTLRTQSQPDYQQAINLIEQAMREYPNDVRLAMERITLASQSQGRDAAGEQIARMSERFPENERLQQLTMMMRFDDPVEAQLAAIDESGLSDLRKHLARASVLIQNGRSEEADAEVAKAKAINPDDTTVLEIEFSRSLERRDFDVAQRLAQRAASLDADGVGGQLYQARLELAEGKHDLAAATLDRVTREDEWNVPAWRFLGSALLGSGRIDDALRAFDRGLKIKPDDMPTIRAYIDALVSVRRLPDALALARRASQLPSVDSSVRAARLELEEQIGDVRFAIDERMRMRSVSPGNRSNNLALAQLFIREGRLDEAEQLLESTRVENAQPDLGAAMVEARLRAAQGRLDDAVERMEREIARLPENRRGEGYVVLADFLFERQRPEQAVDALQRARGSQGESRPVDRKLGDFAFSVGDFERAIASYKAVVDAGADESGTVAKRLAEAQMRVGRLDQALQTIAAVEGKSGEDSQTLLLRAQIALDRQDALEARRLLDRAIEMDPRNHLAFIRRAQLGFTDDTQFAAVQRDLRQAAQLQPDNITVRQMLSQLFIRRGRVNEAIDELAQAVRSRPDNDQLRYEYVRMLGEHGTTDQVLAAIQQAVAERGQDAPQWLTLAGDTLAGAGDMGRAITMYERAHEVAGNPQTLVRLVQVYLGASPPRTQLASQALSAFESSSPDEQYMVALLQARVQAAAGNSRQALQLLAQTWQQSGASSGRTRLWFDQARAAFGANTSDLINFLGQLPPQTEEGNTPAAVVALATLRVGDPSQAVSVLQSIEGLEDRTEDPATIMAIARLRGQLAYVLGDYAVAAEAYRMGLTLSPNDPELNNNLAYTLAKHLGQPQNALAYATKASEVSPLDANVLDTLGLIYLQLDRNTQAEATFQRALDAARRDIERVPVLAHLAQARKRLNDTAGAMNYARQAVQLGETTQGATQLYSSELAEAESILSNR